MNQIHKLNTICLLMLIEEFSSAVENYLNRMVELKKCIYNVKSLKIKFEREITEINEKIFAKHRSRCLFEK